MSAKTLVLVALAGTVLLQFGGSASGRDARGTTLSISPIRAEFDEATRSTHYTVPTVNQDPGTTVRYLWTLALVAVDEDKPVDSGCDNHGVRASTTSEFVWRHGNKGDPISDDGCSHEVLGKYGHQGLVTVVVTDNRGARCTATYKGTNSSDASSVADGVASPASCTVGGGSDSGGNPCKCASLTARIVPSSVKLKVPKRPALRLDFTVHWVLTCTKGEGDCTGELDLFAPRRAANPKTGDKGYHAQFLVGARRGDFVHITCEGACAKVTNGGKQYHLFSKSGLGPIDRSSDSIPIEIERTCRGKFLETKLSIAFDDDGNVNLGKSKLR